MGFFEFFFTGPGWGWKVFGLLCIISTVGDIIVKVINAVFDYKVKKFKSEIVAHIKTEDKSSAATKDDVR